MLTIGNESVAGRIDARGPRRYYSIAQFFRVTIMIIMIVRGECGVRERGKPRALSSCSPLKICQQTLTLWLQNPFVFSLADCNFRFAIRPFSSYSSHLLVSYFGDLKITQLALAELCRAIVPPNRARPPGTRSARQFFPDSSILLISSFSFVLPSPISLVRAALLSHWQRSELFRLQSKRANQKLGMEKSWPRMRKFSSRTPRLGKMWCEKIKRSGGRKTKRRQIRRVCVFRQISTRIDEIKEATRPIARLI